MSTIPHHLMRYGAAVLGAIACSAAVAALPPPTPEQQKAAAAKKEQAAAEAEKQKQELAASMEKVTEHWRSQAKANGWETRPPVPVSAPQGIQASTSQSSASGQPEGRLGSAAQQAPIRSEKLGTAPPSEDVKKKPSDDSGGKK
ncbi:hypothetical protein [Noviherbaspirillum massiliense]|uniref:hypothetical protein n=1 Tax=Noviherbaspirillum massiliense TaxID=1465823 RepID=UPI0003115A45|nr:hypothetical protein [Noviherbaspirillum massiliense]